MIETHWTALRETVSSFHWGRFCTFLNFIVEDSVPSEKTAEYFLWHVQCVHGNADKTFGHSEDSARESFFRTFPCSLFLKAGSPQNKQFDLCLFYRSPLLMPGNSFRGHSKFRSHIRWLQKGGPLRRSLQIMTEKFRVHLRTTVKGMLRPITMQMTRRRQDFTKITSNNNWVFFECT